jgi:tRNA U34 5-methylaminomethyl-2-thiouridine-forming methyltransferase MnmC
LTDQKNLQIITTEDGSHSLYIPEIDETYHSIHGAVQESMHVYIDAGLNYWLGKNEKATTVNLLEIGFGTGLNALLTAMKTVDKIETVYHTLEKHPLQATIIESLNYSEILHDQTLFNKIHRANWGAAQQLTTNFKISKIAQDFKDYTTDVLYDIVYFDAFAPDKQPELWTKSVFERCYQLLKKGGMLVTYSAKGQLKRDLRAVGFVVESLPGPPGKFEITRALKLA